MTPAVQTSEQGEWLLKDDAAKLLGTNPRSVERRARAGMIQQRHLPRLPNERQSRVVYRKADLDAILKGATNASAEGKPNGVPLSHQAAALTIAKAAEGQAEAWVALTTTLSKISESIVPPVTRESRPWLTLEEAAASSGLTKAWLLKEAEAGEGSIATRDMGKGAKGGRWRFFRRDLERDIESRYKYPDTTGQ